MPYFSLTMVHVHNHCNVVYQMDTRWSIFNKHFNYHEGSDSCKVSCRCRFLILFLYLIKCITPCIAVPELIFININNHLSWQIKHWFISSKRKCYTYQNHIYHGWHKKYVQRKTWCQGQWHPPGEDHTYHRCRWKLYAPTYCGWRGCGPL